MILDNFTGSALFFCLLRLTWACIKKLYYFPLCWNWWTTKTIYCCKTEVYQRWTMCESLIDFQDIDPCDGWNMSSTFLYATILRSQTKPRIQPYQAGNSASSPDQYSAQIHTCFIHNDNARDIHSWTFGKLWFNGQCKTTFSCRLLEDFFTTELLKLLWKFASL